MDIFKRKSRGRKPSFTDPPTTYTSARPPLPDRPHQLQQPQYDNRLQPWSPYQPCTQQHHRQHQYALQPILPPRPSHHPSQRAPHKVTHGLLPHLDKVMTQTDNESMRGDEETLFSYHENVPSTEVLDRSLPLSSVVSSTYFSKVNLYSNSKLPHYHPQFNVSFESWAIICLAAQYSLKVYTPAASNEQDSQFTRTGPAKATCIKSVSMDSAKVIVFAIRGSANFSDWAVNLQTAAVSSGDFLQDPEDNYCHAGFLAVARTMIAPVAARIRTLLEQDPDRASYSLVMTGHSAGGAIASLLYAHMAAAHSRNSELSLLAGCFKRIHCITFGAPPVTLLPLRRPVAWKKSLFLSFVNEGDPVARAERAYVRSLLELYAAPPPRRGAVWDVPDNTLCNAGSVVVLQANTSASVPVSGSGHGHTPSCKKTVDERLKEGVHAVTCDGNDLRGVIWGDPVCHLMKLYKDRIDMLAVQAVTAER